MRYQCSAVALRTELPKHRNKNIRAKKKSDILRQQYPVQVVRIELVVGQQYAVQVVRIELVVGSAVALRTS